MNIFKNLFQLAIIASALFLNASSQVQAQSGSGDLKIQIQTEPLAAGYIKFDGVDGECTVQEGRNVVGKNTRTGDKIIVVVKGGKLTQIGVQPLRGSLVALTPNSSLCTPIICTTFNPPKCFTLPGGECVCVCGPWLTAPSGGN